MADTFATEYGWTWNQLADHTYRQIAEYLKRIGKRNKLVYEQRVENFIFQANVHGVKLKKSDFKNMSEEKKEIENPFTDNQKRVVEKRLQQTLREKQNGRVNH